MKYLFLIIRHLFPRRRWKQAACHICSIDGTTKAYVFTMEDQFGNRKQYRVSA